MGVAIRDFIPEGEGPTGAEEARIRRGAIIRTGANHLDFIADPNDPTPPAHTSTAEERMEKASRAAEERAAWAAVNAFKEAQLRLKDMTPATAVQAMEAMPQAVMEMYYAAEKLGANRADILSMFPPVDPDVIHRYAAEMKAAADIPGLEMKAIPDKTVVVTEVTDPEPSDETEEQVAETYLCTECDHAPFKNLAGFKSHVTAKHPD